MRGLDPTLALRFVDFDTPVDDAAFKAYTDRLQEAEYAEKSKEVRDSEDFPDFDASKKDPGARAPVGRVP